MIDIDPGDFTSEALAKIAPTCGECDQLAAMAHVRGIEPA